MSRADGAHAASRWAPTPALWRAVAVGAAGAAGGIVTSRPDLAVAGALLLLSVAAALVGGLPRGEVRVRTRAPIVAATGAVVAVEIEVTAPPGVSVTARLPSWRRTPHGDDGVVAGAAHPVVVRRRLRATGWGELVLARPDWQGNGPDALVALGPVEAVPASLVILPTPAPPGAFPVPPRPTGQRGNRRAQKGGEGNEIVGVRQYRPGDTLRRIEWRVTSRSLATRHPTDRAAALYVRTMVAETDADLAILVDTRLDIAPDMTAWDLDLSRTQQAARRTDHTRRRAVVAALVRLATRWRATPGEARRSAGQGSDGADGPDGDVRSGAAAAGGSLEATVEATVAIAAEHLQGGDRVSVVDLGRPRASIAPGSGRRHLDRIRFRLAQVRVDKLAAWRPGTLSGSVSAALARLPSGAPVVVVSPFYDADVIGLAVSVARTRTVVALDTAPPRVAPDPRVPFSGDALDVVAMERARRLQRLDDAGITVEPWTGRLPAGLLMPARRGRQVVPHRVVRR